VTPRARAGGALLAALLAAGVTIAPVGAQSPGPSQPPTTTTTAKPRKFPLIAPLGLRPILDRERRATRRAERSATTTTSTSTTTTPPHPPPPRTTKPGTPAPVQRGGRHHTVGDP
jgi:hypothetical protein